MVQAMLPVVLRQALRVFLFVLREARSEICVQPRPTRMRQAFSGFNTLRTSMNRNSITNVVHWVVRAPETPAFALFTGQIMTPIIVLCSGNLCVNESIDGLMTDAQVRIFMRQPACDLFW